MATINPDSRFINIALHRNTWCRLNQYAQSQGITNSAYVNSLISMELDRLGIVISESNLKRVREEIKNGRKRLQTETGIKSKSKAKERGLVAERNLICEIISALSVEKVLRRYRKAKSLGVNRDWFSDESCRGLWISLEKSMESSGNVEYAEVKRIGAPLGGRIAGVKGTMTSWAKAMSKADKLRKE